MFIKNRISGNNSRLVTVDLQDVPRRVINLYNAQHNSVLGADKSTGIPMSLQCTLKPSLKAIWWKTLKIV